MTTKMTFSLVLKREPFLAVLVIGFVTHQHIVLGLNPVNTILLLTLVLSTLTFASVPTNVLHGAVHL